MKSQKLFYGVILLFAVSLAPQAIWANDEADQKLDSIISTLENHKDDAYRGYAAMQLGTEYKGNNKAFEALVTALKHEMKSYPRRRIIESLGEHENPKAFEPIKERLERSYDPKFCEIFDLEDVITIQYAFEALGKIKNPLAVDFLLTYFSQQPDQFGFIPKWWDENEKTDGVRAMVKLSSLLSPEELRTLYTKHKSLLWAKSTGWHEILSRTETVAKFAPQAAWFFLNALPTEQDADIHTEIVRAMARDWPSEWREVIQGWTKSKPLLAILRGTLEGQGRYFGRLGQFVLNDSSGKEIAQVKADPSRHMDIYRRNGQEVLVRTEVKMHESSLGNFMRPWETSYTLYLEFQGL